MPSALAPARDTTYIYIDEAGNLDFGEHGTRFFALTGVIMRRPFSHLPALLDAKYDALETGLDLEYFHASEDRQAVRDQVLACLEPHLADLDAYVIVIRKGGLAAEMRRADRLYPAAFSRLMERALTGEESAGLPSRVIVVTDTLPVRRERLAVTKAVKLALHDRARGAFEYRILHHASRADLNLQVADYVSWSVYRLAARADRRSFSRVEQCVRGICELGGERERE
jgi:hypothetical protein